MYFPTSSALIEFLILAVLEQDDSYGYEIRPDHCLSLTSKNLRSIPFSKIGRQ